MQEHNLMTIVVIRDRSHKTERDLCEISQNYADLELDLNELIIRILLKSKKDFWFNKSTYKNKICPIALKICQNMIPVIQILN